MEPVRRGFPFAHLLVIAVVVALLGFIFLALMVKSMHKHESVNCANNLSQLRKMAQIYSVQFGGPEKLVPGETGKKFWLKLSDPRFNLIDSTMLNIYICPGSSKELKAAPGVTHYRGPMADWNTLGDDAVVGMDDSPHASDRTYNVLKKSADVIEVEESDPFLKTYLSAVSD